jgi:hypothetical protein
VVTATVPQPSLYGYARPLGAPYFYNTTRCLDPLVPGALDVSIAGRGYPAETSFTPFKQDAYRSDSIQAIADRQDWSNLPGSASVNNEGLWRREMLDFSKGAGQEYLDRRASQPSRFYKSKGIYPWQQNQATLLNDVVQVHSSGVELQVLTVGEPVSSGSYVYINDGGTIRFATGSLTSWSVVSGVTGASTNAALATDGYNVYIACGTSGVYIAQSGSTTAYSWVTGKVNYIWYAGGELVAAGPNASVATSGNLLYNITLSTPSWPSTPSPTAITAAGPGGATALLYTHANGSFVWDCAAAGASWVYVGGRTSNSAANNSIIYKTQQNSTGTSLVVPIVAATLPGGELVYSLYAYANYILLGTSLGARFCQTLGVNDPGGSAGDLKLGPIVPDQIQQVGFPVRAFVGQFRFIFFGWSNYDAISTGLGRMDLSTFIDSQAPAYTSDLMVSASGEIMSMDWYNGLNNVAGVNTGAPVFVVLGVGVFTAASTYVPQGVIDTGNISYGLPDDKIGCLIDFQASGTAGSVGAFITVDGNKTYLVPSQLVTNDLAELPLPTSLRGEDFDLQLQLNAGSSNTVSPILTGFTLKALECVVMGTIHKAIINAFRTVQTNGVDMPFNPYAVFAFLDGLRKTKEVIAYWEGVNYMGACVIDALTRLPYNEYGAPEGGFNMRFEVSLKTINA